MKLLNKILLFLIIFNFSFAYSKPVPESFADLADKLMPSVVNISQLKQLEQLPINFLSLPPGSPLAKCLKTLRDPLREKLFLDPDL